MSPRVKKRSFANKSSIGTVFADYYLLFSLMLLFRTRNCRTADAVAAAVAAAAATAAATAAADAAAAAVVAAAVVAAAAVAVFFQNQSPLLQVLL